MCFISVHCFLLFGPAIITCAHSLACRTYNIANELLCIGNCLIYRKIVICTAKWMPTPLHICTHIICTFQLSPEKNSTIFFFSVSVLSMFRFLLRFFRVSFFFVFTENVLHIKKNPNCGHSSCSIRLQRLEIQFRTYVTMRCQIEVFARFIFAQFSKKREREKNNNKDNSWMKERALHRKVAALFWKIWWMLLWKWAGTVQHNQE